MIFDGHGSYITYEFLQYCEDNNIIAFALIPHTSHLCQPLDVGVFQSLKHWHGEAIDRAVRAGCRNFNKIEFLHHYSQIRKKVFKLQNIASGWRKTGIYPLNPDIVISQLFNKKQSNQPQASALASASASAPASVSVSALTPATPTATRRHNPDVLSSSPTTPKDRADIQRLRNKILPAIRQGGTPASYSRRTSERIMKLVKVADVQSYQLNLLNIEVKHNQKETVERKRRQVGARRHVLAGKAGPIEKDEARQAIQTRAEHEAIQTEYLAMKQRHRAVEARNRVEKLQEYEQLITFNQQTQQQCSVYYSQSQEQSFSPQSQPIRSTNQIHEYLESDDDDYESII